jgi:hypothetical protein
MHVKYDPTKPLPPANEHVDYAILDATTDEDIARQIAEDPDTASDMSDALDEIARRLENGEPLPPGVRIVNGAKPAQKRQRKTA